MPLFVSNPLCSLSIIPASLLGQVTTMWDGELRTEPSAGRGLEFYPTAIKDPLEATLSWQQPRMSTVGDMSKVIRSLEPFFTFVSPSDVYAFLSDRPYLIPLLVDARKQISTYFGRGVPVYLEIVSDPEYSNDKQMFALVSTSKSPDEAFNALDRLDHDWWLAAGAQARGNLEIDVKFS
jgi:hypothetical protein